MQSKDMPFLHHLEELRWHIIRSLIAIILVAVVLFIYKSFVFDGLLFAPHKANFFTNKWLCELSKILNINSLCINQSDFPIVNIKMAGQFSTHIRISLIGGFVAAFPYFIYEIWRFIKPAFNKKEQSYAGFSILISSLLFFTGILFGYYIITPLSIDFLITYSISNKIENYISLNSYISLISGIVFANGIVFQLPVIVYFLSKKGLLTFRIMRHYRRHAFVFALVLSAIITPPDIFSQILVAIPLIILYECSIFISKKVKPN